MVSLSASATVHALLAFVFVGLGKAAFGDVHWHRGSQGHPRCTPCLMDLRYSSVMDSTTIFEASHLGLTPRGSSSHHESSFLSRVSLLNYWQLSL